MTVAEAIIQHVRALPESIQAEVLDFVEHLEAKAGTQRKTEVHTDWSAFSLSQAMRGLETESSFYSMEDLKEVFA